MSRRWQLAAAAGVVLLSVGCAAAAGESGAPIATVPTGTPAPPASMATPRPDRPPEATLAADGGDPVVGQLGSYTWDGAGSDSPWLPGTPISVGAMEPLTVRVGDDTPVGSWAARRTPGVSASDADAVPVAEGSGPITFPAPGPGDWTVRVEVRFAGGGSAAYAWRLTVR